MTAYNPTKYKLTKANILDAVDEYSLLSYYVTGFKGFNTKMKSNIRTGDKDASLHFSVKHGTICISDFGSSNTGMSTLTYLRLLLGFPDSREGFMSLLDRIRTDFRLPLEPYSKAVNSDYSVQREAKVIGIKPTSSLSDWEIRFRAREWDSMLVDKAFWFDRYGITNATRDTFNVKPLTSFTLQRDERRVSFLASEDNPSYAYVPHPSLNIGGWRRKIYSPITLDSDTKWFNSLPAAANLALHTLPATGLILVVATSLKDVMTCYELFKGYDVHYLDLSSESRFLSLELLEKLRLRFRYIFYYADADEPGIRQATKFETEFHVPFFCNESIDLKDPSDMVWKTSQRETFSYVKSQLETMANTRLYGNIHKKF